MPEPRTLAPERQAQKQALAAQEQTLAELLKRYEPQVRAALPQHANPERILSIIKTSIATNPGIRGCSPLSVLAGIVAASRLGLELDPVLGQAYLVPRWNKNTKRMEACFQIGYRGKLELMHRATPGIIVQTRHVRENDEFELVYEPKPRLTHRINHKRPRGKVVCSYSYVELPDGRMEVFEPMFVEEALAIRDRFGPKDSQGNLVGPWTTDEDEMVRKTTLHRDSKWIAQSVEMKDATRIENRIDAGEAPESVVLDLPADEAASAEAAAATHGKKEDLKRRLAERAEGAAPAEDPKSHEITHDEAESDGQATGRGQDAQPTAAGPVASDSAGGGGTEAGRPSSPTADRAKAPSRMQRLGPPEVKELPDPLDDAYQASMFLRWRGSLWTRNEQNTAWVKVEPEQTSLLDDQQPQTPTSS